MENSRNDPRKKTYSKNQGNGSGGSTNNMSEFTKNEKHLEKLLPKSYNLQKRGASSTSNAGILYYKCLSKAMEKKMNELQKGIEKARSTMKIQKQNITDMINRKNHLLSDFHEQFRKYSKKTEYENKIEDEIEQLVKFLDELMVMRNEISYVKISENNIRNYAIEKFQLVCSELEPVKDVYEKKVEQLQLKLNELKEWKLQWETLDELSSSIGHSIHLHQEKLNHLKWSVKNEETDCEMLRNEGERIRLQTDAEILKTQQTLKNDALKIQQAVYQTKHQFSTLKSNLRNVDEIKQEVANYNETLLKNMQLVSKIETDISEKKIKCEELQEKIEIDQGNLRVSEEEKKIQIQKQEKLGRTLYEYREKINDGETLLKNLAEEERSIEEKLKEKAMEIETQKGKIVSLKTQNKSYSDEKMRNDLLKKEIADLKQKNAITRKRLFELKREDALKEKELDELKNKLLSNNILVHDNASDQYFLHSVLTAENELNITSELMGAEVDALFDKICKQRPHIQNLENRLEELSTEESSLDQELKRKEKLLQETKNSIQMVDASIFALKQNVYQKNCVTRQEYNKQLTTLSSHVENERSALEKLKEEIADLTKKRQLLAPEKKRNLATARTTGLKKKKVVNEKSDSSDSDVYNFK